MKLVIERNTYGLDGVTYYQRGEIRDVDDYEADLLISSGEARPAPVVLSPDHTVSRSASP